MALSKITYPAKNIGDLWLHNEANEIKDVVNAIVDAINGAQVQQTNTTAIIVPNVLNVWGAVSSLNISFVEGQAGADNEYKLQFQVNSSSFTLTLPIGVVWASEPTWENGFIYQVSIQNNLAIYAGWEAASS